MNTYSRRAFLSRSAAAAAAAPMILSSRAFGQDAPSNKVHLALLGVGSRGGSLAAEFVHVPQVKILAVCDCFEDRREDVRNKLNEVYGSPDVQAYGDFREVLARDDIDGVVIATPDHWHVPLAIAAVRAGKDVYLEKPVGVAMKWAWILRDEVKKHKRVLQYGTQQRSEGYFPQACELARNGYLGPIERIDAWCVDIQSQYNAFHVPVLGSTEAVDPPEGFDYNLWLGPAPEKPYTVDRCTCYGTYHIYDYCLGFIAGWGAHPLDIAQWGLGADDTSPVRYEGKGVIPTQGLYDTVHTWDVECAYAGGVKMHFMSHTVAEPIVSAYRPWCDHGTTFFGSDGWVSVDRVGIYASNPALLEITLKSEDVHLSRGRSHAQDFAACMQSRETPISSLEAAIRSDTISHMSDIAIRLKRPINWDPSSERIIEDPEAAAMLDRPLRAPWDLSKPMLS